MNRDAKDISLGEGDAILVDGETWWVDNFSSYVRLVYLRPHAERSIGGVLPPLKRMPYWQYYGSVRVPELDWNQASSARLSKED